MRKPKPSDFDDGCGNIDWDEHDEVMGDYEDEQYDLMKDQEDDVGDQIHEQRKAEKQKRMKMNKNILLDDNNEKEFYLGLFTSKIDEDGNGEELSYEGYERQELKFIPSGDHAVSNTNDICFVDYDGEIEIKGYVVFLKDEVFLFQNLTVPIKAYHLIQIFKKDNDLTINIK